MLAWRDVHAEEVVLLLLVALAVVFGLIRRSR